jgi:methionine-rich copper-binding protein CopC
VALGAALLTASAGATRDAQHLRLERSTPSADTTVTESPATIQLWFNQPPQVAVSRITLRRAEEEITVGETRGASEHALVIDVPSPLGPARYTVDWRAAGNDGHVLRGSFDFTIASTDDRP